MSMSSFYGLPFPVLKHSRNRSEHTEITVKQVWCNTLTTADMIFFSENASNSQQSLFELRIIWLLYSFSWTLQPFSWKKEEVECRLTDDHSLALLLADQQNQCHVTGAQLKHVAVWENPSHSDVWAISTTYTGCSELNCSFYIYSTLQKVLGKYKEMLLK